MSRKSKEELVPRNGHTLETLVVCRISGCQNQKELSLEDQQDNARALVAELFDGEYNMHIISTTAKGESLDRPELAEMERAYCSGKYDLAINDDLSRMVRGGEAVRLMGLGVDHGTRTICISDGIDTADDTWEEDALNACSANVAHNQRTSLRIKQKVMNRFSKYGFTAARPIACYEVPPGIKSFDQWEKKPGSEIWMAEGAAQFRNTCNFTAVADYFNAQGIPVGSLCRKNTSWTGQMVQELYSNPLLMGKALTCPHA